MSSRFVGSDLRDRFEGVARFLRGIGRAIPEQGDVPDLALLRSLHDEVDAATQVAVDGLRAMTPPVSWQVIADGLGVSRQTAHHRWNHP